MIKIVIADDHHIVRQGLRALLEREDNLAVVGEAADGLQAIELVERLRPDILILDIAMPRLDGLQATTQLRKITTATKIIVLSVHNRPKIAQRALQQGAKGYLLKNTVDEALLLAIEAVNRGEIYLSPEISEVIEDPRSLDRKLDGDDPAARLTPREREVLKLVVDGHTNNEIAQLLHISPKTVSKHRTNVMTKLQVNDVTALIRVAYREGLVVLDG